MYKDNGTLDVELLAEVGYIAQRIRDLDVKVSALGPNPLDANTALVHCPNACATTSHCPSNQTASDANSELKASETSLPIKPSVELENAIIEFYEKHLAYHKDKERAAVQKQFRDKTHSRLYQLSTVGDTMNSGSPSRGSNNASDCSASNQVDGHNKEIERAVAAETNPVELNADGETKNISGSSPLCGDGAVPLGKRNSVARGSFSQPMPEIQISASEDIVRTSISAGSDLQKDPSSPGSAYSGDGIGRGTGSCGHYCGGWQSAICTDQLSDEDLRNLVLELRRKVEFTERMNWLCKYIIESSLAIIFNIIKFIRKHGEL